MSSERVDDQMPQNRKASFSQSTNFGTQFDNTVVITSCLVVFPIFVTYVDTNDLKKNARVPLPDLFEHIR